tara:strand:+ start:162 stop:518 length:357 start_codon:yes stop_codon:yes gene_type:complete
MKNQIIIPSSNDKLLKECKIETFRSKGKGGQHVNKTDSAVRLTHIKTNITVSSQKERSQYQNKQNCLISLRKKIDALNYIKPYRIPTQKTKTAKNKILDDKKKQSIKKQFRQKPKLNE